MNSRLKILLAVTLLLLSGFAAFSQHKYIKKKLQVRTDVGETADILRTDNLGQVLLGGYLDGKIKGYQFAIGDTVAKWKKSELVPDAWENKPYYYGDQVTFQGKIYQSIADDNTHKPDVPEYWEITELKEPVARALFFPSLKDTLPKIEFLQRMVERWPENYEPWNHSHSYFQMDRVMYNERSYVAQRDISSYSESPDNDSDGWEEISNDLYFTPWYGCNDITVLFNYTVQHSDTVFLPQMLSVRKFDENLGLSKPICDFYYSDVIGYLETVAQPVTTIFKYGYVGNGLFELSSQTRGECLDWLKSKIKSKSFKPSKSNIKDQNLYAEWLSDTTSAQSGYSQWIVCQHPATRELILSKPGGDVAQAITSFLTISPKDVGALIKKEKLTASKITNLTFSLTDPNLLVTEHWDSEFYDSLPPLLSKNTENISVKKDEYLWLEQYTVMLNSVGSEEIAAVIPQVWTELEREYFSGKVKDVTTYARRSFFSDHHNWNGVSLIKKEKYDETFSLSGDRVKGVHFLQLAGGFAAITVVYQKDFRFDGPDITSSFKPVTFSIIYTAPQDDGYAPSRNVSFDWDDVKRILLLTHDSKMNTLISAIEKGTLNYSDSELIYGLKEK